MTVDKSYAITTVVYCLIFVAGVVGNFLVIAALIRFKKLRTVPMILVTNLSLCDLTLLLASIPLTLVHDKLEYFVLGEVGCRIVWPLSTFAMTSAVFTLVAIAAERFSAIVFPFRHKQLPRFDAYAALIVHVLSLASVVPYSWNLELIKDENGRSQCTEVWSMSERRAYTVFLFLAQYLIPLIIMAILYMTIWIVIRNSTNKAIKASDGSSCTNGSPLVHKDTEPVVGRLRPPRVAFNRCSDVRMVRARQRQRRRTLKMFGCIVSVFAVCVCPTQITWLWNDYHPDNQLSSVVSTVFYFFVYTNSVLNAWIYSGFNKDFRSAFKRILLCQWKDKPVQFHRIQHLPLVNWKDRSSGRSSTLMR